MEFPHLADTQFPLLDNVNVYSYRNVFDYTRWVPNTKVKLTNVLWSGDYNDVVDFASDAERDSWFDSKQDSFDVILRSNHSIPPEGGIKLPIPYDIATRYNYLVVDIPVMTSEDETIEYENIENGVRRWYFFIDEVSSRAPNTTMFFLSLDVWTQFHNDVYIRYMYLERGHAPVAATDTDRYLANPIANNDYLLTPDVTPTNASICRKTKMIPFGNGTKYVCIASTISAPLMQYVNSISASQDYTYGNISYSDVNVRYGYQLQVNGFGLGNGYDYSGLNLPVQPVVTASADSRIGNNLTVWAIPATDVYGDGRFFQDIMATCPQFMNSIRGCFIVDENMITIRQSKVLAGHTIYEVYGNSSVSEISLSKSDFAYPARYERFAKLYTYPYAEIELTDNAGKKVSVRIENTGEIEANLITSVAFPYVNQRVFFTGINGVGSESYEWVNLWGSTLEREIANSDWFDYCFDNEIPCYALYMDCESVWYLENFNRSIRGARRNALVNYHNSVRNANTAMQNAIDSSDTLKSNLLATDATAYNNVDADATTLTTNTANTVDTTRANVDATIATNTSKLGAANLVAIANMTLGKAKQADITTATNTSITNTTVAQNNTTVATTNNNAAGEIAGGFLQTAGGVVGYNVLAAGASAAAAGGEVGAVAGSAVPGPGSLAGLAAGVAVGGIVGMVNGVASWGSNSANANSVLQANNTTSSEQKTLNNKISQTTQQYNEDLTNALNDERTFNVNNDNTLLDANTDRTNTNLTTNNGNTAATMRANAARTKTTSDANVTATNATANANSGYTREVAILNAKETLENARNNAMFAMYDAVNKQAVERGSYAGNFAPDYHMTTGIQVKVKTMPNAEVRQIGDWFARFGYALEQVWDLNDSGLCPMKHFCYWKCRDAWVDDLKASNNTAVDMITSILIRGVTVWKNPDEVGRVSVYDN